MCRNKHRSAASTFLLLQPLEDFLQVLFSAYYSRIFWLTVAGFSWYVTPPEGMSFSELPLQKDGPHNPGLPTEPTSCFGVFSSSCLPSAGQGLAVPFDYPSTLLVALLHQQMTWRSSYSGPFPSFWLEDTTALLILLSPLFPVPCYLPWSVFHGGSCLCFCLAGLLASGTLTSSWVCRLHSSAPLLPFTAWPGMVSWLLCPVGCHSLKAAGSKLIERKQPFGHPTHQSLAHYKEIVDYV